MRTGQLRVTLAQHWGSGALPPHSHKSACNSTAGPGICSTFSVLHQSQPSVAHRVHIYRKQAHLSGPGSSHSSCSRASRPSFSGPACSQGPSTRPRLGRLHWPEAGQRVGGGRRPQGNEHHGQRWAGGPGGTGRGSRGNEHTASGGPVSARQSLFRTHSDCGSSY